MRLQSLLLACALFAFSPTQPAAASECDHTGGLQIKKGPYRLVFQTNPKKPSVGKFFGLTISVCTTDGSPLPDGLKIDATMPMHGHGMNYRPTVKRSAPGKFQATGLMMHMSGSWVLRFDVRHGDKATRMQKKLVLK
jgi:hypothetical protein